MVPIGTVVKGKNLPKPQETPRRTAIVAAAFAVLMEHGYAGASTLEIARRAKVSKRELYAEFGSKSGILEALIAATSAQMQVPLVGANVVDRDSLATALTAYGLAALPELTPPPSRVTTPVWISSNPALFRVTPALNPVVPVATVFRNVPPERLKNAPPDPPLKMRLELFCTWNKPPL